MNRTQDLQRCERTKASELRPSFDRWIVTAIERLNGAVQTDCCHVVYTHTYAYKTLVKLIPIDTFYWNWWCLTYSTMCVLPVQIATIGRFSYASNSLDLISLPLSTQIPMIFLFRFFFYSKYASFLRNSQLILTNIHSFFFLSMDCRHFARNSSREYCRLANMTCWDLKSYSIIFKWLLLLFCDFIQFVCVIKTTLIRHRQFSWVQYVFQRFVSLVKMLRCEENLIAEITIILYYRYLRLWKSHRKLVLHIN